MQQTATQYQSYEIALTVFAAVYMGCFVMVSNHYVLSRKVQRAFDRSSISSRALHQLLVDVLTNLSSLTLILSTVVAFRMDSSLSVMIYSDAAWSGLLLTVIAIRGTKQTVESAHWRLMFCKNIVFLLLVYVIVAGHYISVASYISLGAGLIIVYFCNLAIEAHEQRFASIMKTLFNYKPLTQNQEVYQQTSRMVTPEFLARRCPVSKTELEAKLKSYQPQLKAIKLRPKAAVTEKLLKIALAVHLSNQKFEEKAKRDIRSYYGTFNGTVQQKSKKFVMDRVTTFGSRNEIGDRLSNEAQVGPQSDGSVLFYLFPVRMFESSQPISILFSLVINLGFGLLLGKALEMTAGESYGGYLQMLYGLLLVPLVPRVGRQQFWNSMALTSLWKYCLYGTVLILYSLVAGSFPAVDISSSPILSFAPIMQWIAMGWLFLGIFSGSSGAYSPLFVWCALVLCNCVMIYKFC